MRRFVPSALLTLYHFVLAFVAASWYGFPSRKLVVIGITGTNGKSTVVELTHRIFEAAGFAVASASSLRFIIKDHEWKNELKMTMPGRFFQQRFLSDAVRAGCSVAIIEVTSEGIKQSRHRFIAFDVVAMTNVTPEHIESHGGFDRYLRAKLGLFAALRRSRKEKKAIVVNGDDPSAEKFLVNGGGKKFVYGLRFSPFRDTEGVVPQAFFATQQGIKFMYRNNDLRLRLLGEFNLYNTLCALSIGLARGVPLETIRQGLERVGWVPGRLEFVSEKPFSVVVDYAHTPDALTQVYSTLRSFRDARRLICVLGGAGGGRDRWKRPEMGKIAEKYCDEIFLTDEDPYDENPAGIVAEIRRGITKKVPKIILDRTAAISEAINAAKEGDTVIITGKGAEPWMAVGGGKKIPWDDRKIAREALSLYQKPGISYDIIKREK